MFPLPHVKGDTYAVFGLGRTGLSAARALHKEGAEVLAWDDDPEKCKGLLEHVGIPACDVPTWDWSEITALVLSPGIPLTHPQPHPVVLAAKAANVPVIGDMELMMQALEALGDSKEVRDTKIIAVTGTNGKSTTTALIGHILARAGLSPQVGGNIGKPVLELQPPAYRRVYVLEVSSYQLDLTPSLKPDVAVLLNLAPDHLSRHGGMEGYAASKARIFKNQQADDCAILGIDDEYSAGILAALKARHLDKNGPVVKPITVGRALGQGVYALDGRIVDGTRDPALEIADLSDLIALRGKHNWQNACAAYAATQAVGAEAGRISDAFASFPGLAHRQELVGRQGHVAFINDSKATNGEATAVALAAYDNIYWIVGGEPKEGGLKAAEAEFGHVTKAYLVGRSAPQFEKELEGKLDCVTPHTIDTAVRMAFADALAADGEEAVVLLSPACASFDQYRDFEERGDAFRTVVRGLISQKIPEGAV